MSSKFIIWRDRSSNIVSKSIRSYLTRLGSVPNVLWYTSIRESASLFNKEELDELLGIYGNMDGIGFERVDT